MVSRPMRELLFLSLMPYACGAALLRRRTLSVTGRRTGTWSTLSLPRTSSLPNLKKEVTAQYAFCVGCDRVQADHAPDGGVAQGIFHGILVRHHGRNQEEVEEGLEKEVERQEEEDAQTTTCTCMDGMR